MSNAESGLPGLEDAATPNGPLGFLVVAMWAGLLAGLVEVGVFAARAEIMQHGLWRNSPHLVWMIPLACFVLFGLAGLTLVTFIRPIPRIGRPLAAGLLCTLALMTPLLAVPGIRAVSCLILAAGLSCWVVPAIKAHPKRFRSLVRWSLPALGVVILTLVGHTFGRDWARGQAAAGSSSIPSEAPNVLLIVLDTVRADATSLNGSERDTTPNLAAFAERGARFERAIASSSWTLPSHASLFTGRWSWELNVGPDRALDDRYPTLAEYLGGKGYATAGFVANSTFCTAEYGLSRGFGHYEDFVLSPLEALRASSLGWLLSRRLMPIADRLATATREEASHPLEWRTHRKTAEEINRNALRWIEKQPGRPFFVFLNYIDAHDPYLVPDGAQRPFSGRPSTLAERRELRDWIAEVPRERSPEHLQLARDAYDDCLAYLDGQIGALLDDLKRLGRLDNTVVVITSDHGEHFGERERDGFPLAGHRLTVYQPEVHVPLAIVAPGRVEVGTVVAEAVSLRDLPATLIDLLDFADDSPFPGRSVLQAPDEAEGPMDRGPVLAEFSPNEARPVTIRYQTGAPGLARAIVTEEMSYHRLDDGREELYDLRTDPLETRNLADDPAHEERLSDLRAAFDGFLPSDGG